MVVYLNDEDFFFSGDFPDIAFVNVDEYLKLTLFVKDKEVLAETYYPNEKAEIVLRKLGEIIDNHFTFPDLTGDNILLTEEPLPIRLEMSDSQSTVTRTVYVFFSRTHVSFQAKEDSLFFSNYKIKNIREDSIDYITFYVSDKTSIKCNIIYVENGISNLYSMKLNLYDHKNCMMAYQSSLDKISSISNIASENILSYDFYITNGTLSDKVKYIVNRKKYHGINQFLYYNVFGFPESLLFTGFTEYNPDLSGEMAEFNSNTLRPAPELKDVRTINSGFIESAKYNAVLDMLTSSKIRLYDTSSFLDIVITNIDFQHKRIGNEKINVKLTYRPSERNALVFSRIRNFGGVFDYTFDKTYE